MRVLSRSAEWSSGAILTLPLGLLFVLGDGNGPSGLSAAYSGDGPYRIAVNVNLVVLHATVSDRRGHLISGLQREDFQVYEDSLAQQISLFRHEDVPVTVGVVVDHSGSMRSKLPDVIAAADTFARASNSGDQMFVVNFNERVSLGLPTGVAFTGKATELAGAISRTAAAGKTALYDAVIDSLKQLMEGTRDKKVLVVISDGGDNASRHRLPIVMKLAEESDAIIYAIGLFDENDPDRNPNVLDSLARATGGEAFFPKGADRVVGICEQIAKDIRNQYTLGYTPPPASTESTYRTIRVVARAPHQGKLFVRTRAGYIPAANRPVVRQTPGGTANETPHQ